MSTQTLFTNAAVLDVVAGRYRDERHVLVVDGRIERMSVQPIDAPDVRTIDVTGRTLMPGLADAHVHVTAFTADFPQLKRTSPFLVAAHAARLMRAMIERGFTTVRDAGGADWGLAQAVEEGLLDGPRLLYCGQALSQTGGHGDMRGPGEEGLHQCFCCAGLGHVFDGVSEARRVTREEVRRGATHIKVMASGGVSSPTDRITSTQFSMSELRAIVEEADAAMIPVMAHAYTARAANRALEAGVRSIEHGNLIDDRTVELLLEKDAWLVPTLSTYQALVEEGEAAGMPAHLVAKTWEVLDAGMVALERAYKAGVKIAYGTDLLGIMQRRQSGEFTLRAAVVSPPDLVRQATCEAAALFGMSDRIGQVSEGFIADLLVVNGDPLTAAEVLANPERNINLVMKAGTVMVER